MKICAIVVTRNRKELLTRCLNALASQTRPPDAILVVDNASSDGTPEMVREAFPGVALLRLPDNQGPAGAYHEGLKWAWERGFDAFWTFDDDAYPEKNALKFLQNFLETWDVIAPANTSYEGRVYGIGRWRGGLHLVLPRSSNEVVPIQMFMWSGVLIHRRAVERAGLPRKDLFICREDTEWAFRLSRNGVRIGGVLPPEGARIIHPISTQQVVRWGRVRFREAHPPWRYYYDTRNTWIMLGNLPGWEKVRARAEFLWILVRRSLGDVVYGTEPRQRIRNRLRGLLDGIRGRTGKRDV